MWIDEWLLKYGLKQSELAKMTGIEKARMNLIVRGKVSPTPKQSKAIYEATKGGVPLEDLVMGGQKTRSLEFKRENIKP